jgi:hypothetical protein
MITVIDVIRDMSVEPSPQLCWPVGNRTRERWMDLYGHPPLKELRCKTYDGGTHCFAVYPDSFRSEIALIVASEQAEQARQGDLFRSSELGERHWQWWVA